MHYIFHMMQFLRAVHWGCETNKVTASAEPAANLGRYGSPWRVLMSTERCTIMHQEAGLLRSLPAAAAGAEHDHVKPWEDSPTRPPGGMQDGMGRWHAPALHTCTPGSVQLRYLPEVPEPYHPEQIPQVVTTLPCNCLLMSLTFMD